MTKYSDGMLDIETLSTGDMAVITQVAFIPFDIQTGEYNPKQVFASKLNIQEQLEMGRLVEANTILFWLSQPKEAQEEVFAKEDADVDNTWVLEGLSDFIKMKCYKKFRLWQHSTFDVPKLDSLYKSYMMDIPWHYRCPTDIRTLRALAGEVITPPFAGVKHNAIDDCINQINYVSTMWNVIK